MNIRDIAKMAGVSASTVSKVMNGKDKDISEETRKKVLKIVEEQKFIPYYKLWERDAEERRLIGLILRADNRNRDVIVPSVEQALAQEKYSLVVNFAQDSKEMAEIMEEMRKKGVSGFLIDSREHLLCDKSKNMTVYLNETKAFDERQRAAFYYNLADAGRVAVERLCEAGHRRIACMVLPENRQVLEGYRQEMQNRNMTVQAAWMYEGKDLEEIEHFGIHQCLEERVTAVVLGSEEIALCVWKMLEQTEILIPDMLSVVTVGDSKWMEILGTGMTTVELPVKTMCESAVKYLIHMISGKNETGIMREFIPRLIERNSVAQPPREKRGEDIVVVGSMNMDIMLEVSRIPINGETQIAEKMLAFTGGKGGNQAVGAGKLGGQVYMIGCLGNDIEGRQMYTNLREHHVHMEGVKFDKTLASGRAYISVDKRGESTILVYQGANRNLDIYQINRCKHLFQKAKYCLLSMEIGTEVVEYTIKFCKANHTEVILKPSAVEKIKEELLLDVTYFIPNERELKHLVPEWNSLEEKAEYLLKKGVKNVIVTLGEKGCYLKNREYSMYFPGTKFEAVDTTGGADSFISALAVALSEGRELLWAIRFAIVASGITVTRYGVQPALPDRKAVEAYEDEIYAGTGMTDGR